MKKRQWYFYVLECSDNSFYAGITTGLNRRIKEHNKGKGAKYTKGRRPVKLLFSLKLPNQSEALKTEHKFKKLPRKAKERIIKNKKFFNLKG